MDFLNRGGIVSRDHHRRATSGHRLTTISAEEADGRGPLAVGDLEGREDIGASSGGREDHQCVLIREHRLARPTEDRLEAVIIGDAGDGGGVCVEAGASNRGPIGPEPSNQFFGKVQRFGGGATIAAGIDGPTRGDGVSDRL